MVNSGRLGSLKKETSPGESPGPMELTQLRITPMTRREEAGPRKSPRKSGGAAQACHRRAAWQRNQGRRVEGQQVPAG